MRHLIAAMATVIAACSIPEKQPTGPFDCHGQGPPMIAADQVTITGTVVDPKAGTPVAAMIDGFDAQTKLSTFTGAMTDGMGRFSATHGTGGAPVREYLRITPITPPPSPGMKYFNTFYYPALPVAADLDIGLIEVYSDAAVGDIVQLLQIPPSEMPDMTNKGMLTVGVNDCIGRALGGATVSISSRSAVQIYYLGSDGRPSPTATVTDFARGSALIFNVPGDPINVDATAMGGMQLQTNLVLGEPAAVVEAQLQP